MNDYGQLKPFPRGKIRGIQLYQLESLILAQNERWRRGSGMQVERFRKEQWQKG